MQRGKIRSHGLQEEAELDMGDRSKVTEVLGFVMAWKEKSRASAGSSKVWRRREGDNLSSTALFRFGGGPNVDLEATLVCKAVCFSQALLFPWIAF